MASQKAQLVDTFMRNLASDDPTKKFDLKNDTIKVALLLSTTNITAATETYSQITGELSAGKGYVVGGQAIANQSLTLSGNILTFSGDDLDWLVPSGTPGVDDLVARKFVFYDDTLSAKPVICFGNLDSADVNVTVTPTNHLYIPPHATNGFFRFLNNNS